MPIKEYVCYLSRGMNTSNIIHSFLNENGINQVEWGPTWWGSGFLVDPTVTKTSWWDYISTANELYSVFVSYIVGYGTL